MEQKKGAAPKNLTHTNTTAQVAMLPELLAWTSSLEDDRSLVREDLLGSAAHVTMLSRMPHKPRLFSAAERDAVVAELLAREGESLAVDQPVMSFQAAPAAGVAP